MHYGKNEKMGMPTMEKTNQKQRQDSEKKTSARKPRSSHELKGETQGVEWATHVYI